MAWALFGAVAMLSAALYEQDKVHHVGVLGALENECCTWAPDVDESPSRMDALVWAVSELMSGARPAPVVMPLSVSRESPWSSS